MTTIGEGALQQKTFSIEWKIEGFSAGCKRVGDHYKSATFPIRFDNKLAHWHLWIYPGLSIGENSDNTKSINDTDIPIYLCYKSDNASEVTVDYKISIVSDKCNIWDLKTKTFKGPQDYTGFDNLIKKDAIKDADSGVLVDDTLTILCEITFYQTGQNVEKKIKEYENLLNNIGKGFENYEELLESNCHSDVTFNIQDKQMYLHKAILMCRNSVFKAMFNTEIEESKEKSVDITDVDFPVMKELFRFIYSGKVEDIEKIAKDLLIAADKYCVTELKAMCEKTLYQSLAADNALEYLKFTERCDTVQLKKLVTDFVVANLKDIVETSDFDSLFADISREVVGEIMKALARKD